MAINEKLNYLIETKSAIKNALIAKGAEVSDTDTFRSYADKISLIEGGSSKASNWAPEPDWWDIDTILAEDTENYTCKAIFLLTDEDVESPNETQGANKYKLSDGQVITPESALDIVQFNFDTSLDKICSKGYKTRYVICYYSGTPDSQHEAHPPTNTLYGIIKNFSPNTDSSFSKDRLSLLEALKIEGHSFRATSSNQNFKGLYALKAIISDYPFIINGGIYNFFYNSRSIRQLPVIDIANNNSMNSIFYGCGALDEVFLENTGYVTDFTNAFAHCYGLRKIDGLNFNSANNTSTIFNSCYNLRYLTNISNIKMKLDFSASKKLTHQSLLNIIEALIQTSASKSIVLGNDNLAKLTDTEKASITNKGWTAS